MLNQQWCNGRLVVNFAQMRNHLKREGASSNIAQLKQEPSRRLLALSCFCADPAL